MAVGTLDPPFFDALETLSKGWGTPPSYLLAALYLESRFNHDAHTPGTGFWGLSQLNTTDVRKLTGLDGPSYLQLAPSEQLTRAIGPWYTSVLNGSYCGTGKSVRPATAGVFYACNLAPCAVGDGSAGTVLYKSPSREYQSNSGLDFNHDGAITIGDLDAFLYRLTTTGPEAPPFQAVLAQLNDPTPPYGDGPPADPTTNEAALGRALQAGLLGLAVAGAAAIGIAELVRSRGPRRQVAYAPRARRAQANPIRLRDHKDATIALGAVAVLAGAGAYLLARRAAASATNNVSTASTFGSDVLARARTDLGVTETGPNSGPRVDQFLATYGLPPGVNWCAAAVGTWIREAAGADGIAAPIPGSASARATGDQFAAGAGGKTGWLDADTLRAHPETVQPGMIVIWSRGVAGSRLGHIGVVSSTDARGGFTSIEGNSGPAGDRVGEWDHTLSAPNLVGMGFFNDAAVFANEPGVAGLVDPPGALLFDATPTVPELAVNELPATNVKGLLGQGTGT